MHGTNMKVVYEMISVYYTVGTGSLNKAVCASSVKGKYTVFKILAPFHRD